MPGSFLTYPIRSDKLTMTVKVAEALLRRKTRFQSIDIVRTEAFGRMMFLDGHVQLAELDEHVYHECLVHIPLLNIAEPKSALIVGGGDGAVLRELCKWPLERIDLVEIDAEVIEASREAWPELSNGAFEDSRARVHIEDAVEFVGRARNLHPLPPPPPEQKEGELRADSDPYDLILLDATDVYEEDDAGLSEMLFTADFYRDCRELLSQNGFLVTQADNPVFCPYSLRAIRTELGKVFERTGGYAAPVPSFGGYSAFCWASRGAEIAGFWPDGAPENLSLRYLNPFRYAQAMSELVYLETSSKKP